MATPGDTRFGQWADPSFAASLGGGSQPSTTGVLSRPDAPVGASASDNAWSPSASANSSGYDATPGHQAFQNYDAANAYYNKFDSAPGNNMRGGVMTNLQTRPWGQNEIDPMTGKVGWQENANDIKNIALADGGEVPDDQDTGDAAPAPSDPFSLISSALSYGRQKFQMPSKLFGQPAEPVTGYEQGGEVDGDGDDDGDPVQGQGQDQQGVIPNPGEGGGGAPQQPQQQGQQLNPQAAMAYLKGAGAAPPQAADMMERRVDPHNALDPTERRMEAVTAAGTPDKAFSLLQHYRQKFNAYSAFADTALKGAGGRPPNVEAAADALNKAYSFVPDGTSVKFSPHQGGMHVAVRKIIPARPAGPGGDQPDQNPFPTKEPAIPFGRKMVQNDQDENDQTQTFADGGEVQDDDSTYETAGGQDLNWKDKLKNSIGMKQYGPEGGESSPQDGMIPEQSAALSDDPNAGTPPSQSSDQGPIQKALGGRRPDQAIKEFVVGLPQLLGLGQKAGFDATLDHGGFDKAAVEHLTPTDLGPNMDTEEGSAPEKELGVNEDLQRGSEDDRNARQKDFESRSPKAVGKAAAAQAAEEADTPKSVIKQISKLIDQQFPAVSQSAQNAEAKKAALETYLKGLQTIESEKVKGVNSLDRARETGASKERQVHETNETKKTIVATQQEHGDARAHEKFTTTRDVADKNRASRESEGRANREAATGRAIITQDPRAAQDKDRFNKAQTNMGMSPQPTSQPANQAWKNPADAQPQQPQQQFQPAPQNKVQRVAGQTYQTPQGPLTWTGTGWVKPGP